MHPSGIQALLIMTNPVCVELLFLLEEGVSDRADLIEQASHRLGADPERIPEILDGLVRVGFALSAGDASYSGCGEEAFRNWNADAWRHVHWLRSLGDDQQSRDLELALDAAWDTRSLEPVRRRRGHVFRASDAGRRHAARLTTRTLGTPFAPGDCPDPAEADHDGTQRSA